MQKLRTPKSAKRKPSQVEMFACESIQVSDFPALIIALDDTENRFPKSLYQDSRINLMLIKYCGSLRSILGMCGCMSGIFFVLPDFPLLWHIK